MKKVQQEIGWAQGIVVPSTSRGGGLALLWKFDLIVTLRFQNKRYVDVLIDSGGYAQQVDKRVKLFRFESMWLKHEQCEEVLKEAWETGLQLGTGNPIGSCLEGCRIALTKWNSQVFGHIGKKLDQVQRKFQTLEAHAIGLANKDQISEAKRELNKLYAMEEDMWYQRARSNWAKSGDKNTRYFHEKTSSRKKKNTIFGLMDESNQWQEDPELIKGIAINYYKNLFSSANSIIQDELLDAIDARV
ncbi:hypothetical protein SO802_023176 [Lithocarpus litseifolius]|uniref:Uncharacterized protein n=1 Tax=Lithocarpus litseifolius TaxID=425828 RepID=A0AAW2C691_9ROSI